MTPTQSNAQPSRALTIFSWVLRILLALVFLGAGAAKLAGVEMMVQAFEQIGLGQGFRYITGVVEIGGAIGLMLPWLVGPAALWLAATMVGAVLAHLIALHTTPAPAVVLLMLTLLLAWLRRDSVRTLVSRFLAR